MRARAAFALILLFVPTALAFHDNDAGTGQDAPAVQALALNLVPGAYTGGLYEPLGDVEDWYKLTAVPPLRGVIVNVTATIPEALEPCVGIFRSNGDRLDTNGCDPIYPVVGPSVGEDIFIRIAAPAEMIYEFEVGIARLPDLALTVTEVTTDPMALDRLLRVRVENLGSTSLNYTGFVRAGSPSEAPFMDQCDLPGGPLAAGDLFEATIHLPGLAHVGERWVFARVIGEHPFGEMSVQNNVVNLYSGDELPVGPRDGFTVPGFGDECEVA